MTRVQYSSKAGDPDKIAEFEKDLIRQAYKCVPGKIGGVPGPKQYFRWVDMREDSQKVILIWCQEN